MKMVESIEYPTNYEGEECYFFISYSHNSQQEVYFFLKQLNRLGVRFWYDKGLKKGVDWEKYVQQKMKNAICVLSFFDTNFFNSSSLQKECQVIKDNRLDYCPIYYEGFVYQQLFRRLPVDLIIDEDVDDLLRSLFNGKITGIIFRNNEQIIKEIFEEAQKFSAISEGGDKLPQKPTKKFAFLAKKSIFSASILTGVQNYFASSQYIIEPHLIEDFEYIPIEYAFRDKLKKFITEDYDGVIIRPLGRMDSKTFELFEELCKQKSVVLCDVGLTEEQNERFSEGRRPAYVCSDFELGGEKIATVINQICHNQGLMNVDIVVCAGPTKNEPATIRSDALIKSLHKNKDRVTNLIYFNSLNPSECFEKIKAFFKHSQNTYIKDKSLIIYLGNDNVALHFAKRIKQISINGASLDKYKKIVILGYDGIVGSTGNSILEESAFDYATIDTLPFEQGRDAAKALIKIIESQADNLIVKVVPKIIKKIELSPRVVNKFSSVEMLTENAGAFVLDLDGTIADTETFHWAAYNTLLESQYGFMLSEEHIKKYIGNSEIKIYRMIEQDFKIKIDDEDFLQKRIAIYLKLIEQKKLEPFEWAKAFFKRYQGKKIVLLTSQIPSIVDHLLSVWGLEKAIPENMRICAHDGKITKQSFLEHPERYVPLSSCDIGDMVVFEDSEHVAKMATDYGYTTIGIRHKFNKTTLKSAICIIDDSIKKGLFVGLSGIDVVFNIKVMPQSDQKIKTDKYDITVGGPALRAAITCMQLGGNATLLTGIGEGPLSELIKNTCFNLGIEIIDIMPDKALPNMSFVGIRSNDACRDIVSGQTVSSDIRSIPDAFYQQFDYCLYDCNFPFFTKELIENLMAQNISLCLDCGSWKPSIDYALRYAECVITSSSFVSLDNENIFELKEKYAIDKVAKTNGGNPIEFEEDGIIKKIEISKKEKANTLGAGDVLHGAFCHYYYDKSESFEAALRHASVVATAQISDK